MIYQLILIFVGLGMDQFVDDEAEGFRRSLRTLERVYLDDRSLARSIIRSSVVRAHSPVTWLLDRAYSVFPSGNK